MADGTWSVQYKVPYLEVISKLHSLQSETLCEASLSLTPIKQFWSIQAARDSELLSSKMGINGLWKIIAAAGEKESLHSIAVREATERKTSGSRRLILGVDMRGAMVECVAAQQTAGLNGRFHGGELKIFFNKLAVWLRSPFTLVFVFDGHEKPGIKRGTEVVSKELWWEDLSKELIGLCGYHWVQAAGEGEAELGALNKHNLIDGVITADGDAFVFGAKRVFRV
ncbi:hypothetical protein M413DRAFT_26867 [Hebeloma cylindrosporum]|uniref:XPG-I domain-containing protein n=1 Tax=Hebeloma cylindrosporum TaxID=76867 RepID=A0A0C2YPC0_HEBCY|nr:hypothetical protein M413DRAFT_26867 [Hebeloma cylindrosporum h7]